MRLKAVVFDLDGTLLDTMEDMRAATNAAMRACGFPELSLGEVRAIVGRGLRAVVEKAVPEGTPQEQTERCLEVFLRYYEAHMNDATRPYPGVRQAMERLRAAGVRTGVLSNKDDAAAKALVRAHFGTSVDVCLGTRPGLPLKPAPEPVRELLCALDAGAGEAAYVGDTGIDVQAARAAGLRFIGAGWGFWGRARLLEAGARRVVETAEELFAALAEERS